MRIAALCRIENASQLLHSVEVRGAKLLGHEIDLLHANAMLASDAAAECDTFFQNFFASMDGAFHLVWITFIIQDERMDVAIAGVENICDPQPISAAGLLNEFHYFWKFRTRHDSILGEVIRAEPANGSGRALS